MKNVKWDLWPHPKNASLKVLVAYAQLSGTARNLTASKILCVIPLYDLRDLNHDGTYGWGEWLLTKTPVVGGALAPMAEAELMARIGYGLKDYDFARLAEMKALSTAFKTADQAFRKSYILPMLTGPASQALGAFKLDSIAEYIIEQAYEAVVEKLLGID